MITITLPDYPHLPYTRPCSGSAPPASVPTASLQQLTRQAAQPQQFVRQFSAASSQHIPQLSGMVDLLNQVSQDEDIKAALNSRSRINTNEGGGLEAGGNMNSPDYKKLRERLLKEVVSSTNAQLVSSKPKAKKVFSNRPNLTANFLMPNDDNGLGDKENISRLKGVPASSQESSLLSELLYTLLGNTGEHMAPSCDDSGLVTFSLDRHIDPSLKSLIQRLLPLASHYSAVVAWCEETSGCREEVRMFSTSSWTSNFGNATCRVW